MLSMLHVVDVPAAISFWMLRAYTIFGEPVSSGESEPGLRPMTAWKRYLSSELVCTQPPPSQPAPSLTSGLISFAAVVSSKTSRHFGSLAVLSGVYYMTPPHIDSE